MDEPNTPVPVEPMPEPKPKKPINSIDKANDAIERMEAANAKTEELLIRQESLRASEILGGKSKAGEEAKPEEPPKQTPEEYREAVLRGDYNEKTKDAE